MKPYALRGLSEEMSVSPKNAEKVVLVSCVLHNSLRTKIPLRYKSNSNFDNVQSENETVHHGL